VTANMTGITISNGSMASISTTIAATGGGIANAGTLALSGVVVGHNSVTGAASGGDAFGGGVYSTGALSIDHSTVSNNTGSSGGTSRFRDSRRHGQRRWNLLHEFAEDQ